MADSQALDTEAAYNALQRLAVEIERVTTGSDWAMMSKIADFARKHYKCSIKECQKLGVFFGANSSREIVCWACEDHVNQLIVKIQSCELASITRVV
jgi:hypothetical protein